MMMMMMMSVHKITYWFSVFSAQFQFIISSFNTSIGFFLRCCCSSSSSSFFLFPRFDRCYYCRHEYLSLKGGSFVSQSWAWVWAICWFSQSCLCMCAGVQKHDYIASNAFEIYWRCKVFQSSMLIGFAKIRNWNNDDGKNECWLRAEMGTSITCMRHTRTQLCGVACIYPI